MKALVSFLVLVAASFGAVTKITTPVNYNTVSSSTRAQLASNFSEIETRANAAFDSVDEVRGRFGGYSGDFTVTSLDNLRLRLDSDGSQTSLFALLNGATNDTLFRVKEDSTWRTWGAGIGTKLTLSDSILAATARISGLTASRLMATNSGSTLSSVSDLTSWIAGTSNQITSTSDGDGSITLSIPSGFTLPSASPTFTGLTLTGNETIGGTLGVTGKITGSDTVAALLGFRAGSAGSTDVSLYRSGTDTWYTPDTLQVGGKIVADLRVRAGTSMPTYSTKRFTAIGNSFDNTALQMENTDVGTMAQGRAFNWGITDVSATEGRLDLTIPSVLTALSVFYNGNVGIGSTTDGGQNFQVAGTSRFAGAATFASTIATPLTASRTVVTDGSGNLSVNTETGTGSHVKATSPTISGPTFSGTITTPLTASLPVFTNGSSALTTNAVTGTGNVMMSASPTTTGTLTGAAANFSGAVSTGALTATSATLGGGEAFTYGDTSFTLTATGMTTSPTGTAYASRVGNVVTLFIPYITGTSNSTGFTLTGLPSGWIPSRHQSVPVVYAVNNSTNVFSTVYAILLSTGTITLGYGAGGTAGWTSSGDKAIGGAVLSNGNTITYLLQ